MRTTVTLEPDVAAAIDRLRSEHGLGLSEAVNRLVRTGLQREPVREPFVLRTHDMGLRIDLTCIGEALELAEGPDYR